MASIIRLYIDSPLIEDGLIELPSDQAHYVNNVMRLKVGDKLALFNGREGEWSATITQARKKNCTLQVGKKTRQQESCPDLMLVFAPIKKQRLDFIMEKATELGVSRFQPVITKRTIVSKIRTDRLHAQTIEASEQCERLNIPEVLEAVSLPQLIQDWSKDRTLFVLNEHGGSKPILEGLQQFVGKSCGPCAFLVGPEGGFDPSELDLLEKLQNVVPLSVGPRILRADTAALAAISCWQSVLGDWQAPLRDRFNEEE
ncbi:Ribosomal RNA small subunit methyltransferase E [Candidatus Terasakiella magnetica]|uniref:Ribosomal RNA small subunit methyltransferase E n=1 Tax=Candidatus Terasakiella magnetica TaxID=1867952 RepID=A0A1C3RIS7_9PROT|nr:16S rRNA (uracil(1498)-N(3))-methyltransferase [Candidatus Terasakiella magnetica]SCA57172.1 Ribosomal RNA small subunit methyltransferase E [Candidatus Terasakiella magnetica]